jgi:hypothetical protein
MFLYKATFILLQLALSGRRSSQKACPGSLTTACTPGKQRRSISPKQTRLLGVSTRHRTHVLSRRELSHSYFTEGDIQHEDSYYICGDRCGHRSFLSLASVKSILVEREIHQAVSIVDFYVEQPQHRETQHARHFRAQRITDMGQVEGDQVFAVLFEM